MPILGAHMSIAGGYYKSVIHAHNAGCDCVQLFTKNNNQWRAKPITDEEADRFKETMEELGIGYPISHDSYLINMGSPKPEAWQKSVDAYIVELQRAEQLGIPYVVAHPGAYTESSEQEGLDNIVRGLDEVHRKTEGIQAQCLLETTAGQGTNLGWKFEHLGYIIDHLEEPERVGVCVDTCHIFAAGYAMETKKEYDATFKEFDQHVGIEKIKAFHLNDSKKEFGSRVDRHDAIGEGFIGIEPFRHLMNDKRFAKVPMYLETPKGERDGEDLDRINLATLRELVGTKSKAKGKLKQKSLILTDNATAKKKTTKKKASKKTTKKAASKKTTKKKGTKKTKKKAKKP